MKIFDQLQKLNFALVQKTFLLLERKERLLVLVILLFRLTLVALDLLGIFLIGAVAGVISGTVISETSLFGRTLSLIEGLGFQNPHILILGTAIIFFISKALISISLINLTAKFVAKIEWDKASKIYNKLINSPLEEMERLNKQETIFLATESITSATSKTILLWSSIVSESALLIGISLYLAFYDLPLFVSVSLFFCFVGLAMNRFVTKSSTRVAEIAHQKTLAGQGILLDTLNNFKQLTLSKHRSTLAESYSQNRLEFASKSAQYQTISGLPRYITEIAVMLGVSILFIQKVVVDPSSTAAPTIAIFLAGIFRIVSSMLPLQSAIASWRIVEFQAVSAVSFLTDKKLATIQRPGRNFTLETGPVGVSIQGLDYKYDQNNELSLFDVNLEIEPGQFVAVVGSSGSGKTTLADLILGLRTPTSGYVHLNSINAREFVLTNPGSTSYVPQNPVLYESTLRANVSQNFGTPLEREDETVIDALRRSGLNEFLTKLPEGLATNFRKNGKGISGGEIQRLVLARAIHSHPGLLVLDEATSALDNESQQAVVALLRELKGQVTLIVIAHRRETLADADVIYKVTNGAVSKVQGAYMEDLL